LLRKRPIKIKAGSNCSGEKDRVLSEIESLNISKDVLPVGIVRVLRVLCMADIFVLPSQFEGLLWPCSKQCLAIAFYCEQSWRKSELVNSGTNGILIEPNNLEDLVEKLCGV